MAQSVKSSIKNGRFTLLIDDLPHFSFRISELVFFQSFIDKRRDYPYVIEFVFSGADSYTEYSDRELWAQIITLLNAVNDLS